VEVNSEVRSQKSEVRRKNGEGRMEEQEGRRVEKRVVVLHGCVIEAATASGGLCKP